MEWSVLSSISSVYTSVYLSFFLLNDMLRGVVVWCGDGWEWDDDTFYGHYAETKKINRAKWGFYFFI